MEGCDLDTDSDNDNGKSLPEMDLHEEQIEEDAPGKIIIWNKDDDDANDTADYLDGDETGDPAGNDLIPIVLSLGRQGPWRLRTEYLGQGRISIWKASTKGANQEVTLGSWHPRVSGDFNQVFYIEGLAASSQWGDVKICLDVDLRQRWPVGIRRAVR